MSYTAIESVVNTALRAEFLALDVDVAWPNMEFTSTKGRPYVTVYHRYVGRERAAFQVDEYVTQTELYINFPAGAGPGRATNCADTLAKAFPVGYAFPVGPGFSVVQSCELDIDPETRPDWWTVALIIRHNALLEV